MSTLDELALATLVECFPCRQNIVDEHTREALAMDVHRAMGADQVVAVIERLVRERGAPEHLRMDNGPELVA